MVDRLDAVRRFMARAPLEALDQAGLHAFIDRLQLHINELHNGIARIFFPKPQISGVQQLSQSLSQPGQTQSQTSLAF